MRDLGSASGEMPLEQLADLFESDATFETPEVQRLHRGAELGAVPSTIASIQDTVRHAAMRQRRRPQQRSGSGCRPPPDVQRPRTRSGAPQSMVAAIEERIRRSKERATGKPPSVQNVAAPPAGAQRSSERPSVQRDRLPSEPAVPTHAPEVGGITAQPTRRSHG